MKISNHTDRLEGRFGALEAVKMTAAAGFEAIDYSMYTADGAVFGRGGSILVREMRNIAEGMGVAFNQAHAPFAKFKPGDENEEENRKIFYSMRRAIEIGAELGAETVIVHPAFICPCLTPDQRFEMNMEIYSRLLTTAREYGVRIAIENMYGRHRDDRTKIIRNVCSHAEEFIRYVDAFDSPYVTACLDVGHAGLVGESADGMIRALGARIGNAHSLHPLGLIKPRSLHRIAKESHIIRADLIVFNQLRIALHNRFLTLAILYGQAVFFFVVRNTCHCLHAAAKQLCHFTVDPIDRFSCFF